MKAEKLKIENIPTVIYGEQSEKVFLYVHGKCGNKEEAQRFAEIAVPKGYQVISVDLPQHGERKDEANTFYPWVAIPELKSVINYINTRWNSYSVRANSIGAMFCMNSFDHFLPESCFFVSPIVDMEKLISDMMLWANVNERELFVKKEINTSFGETLSWEYYCWALLHKIKDIKYPVHILYAGNDNLTSRETISDFADKNGCELTVYEEGEHWFHTPEQLAVLEHWESELIK